MWLLFMVHAGVMFMHPNPWIRMGKPKNPWPTPLHLSIGWFWQGFQPFPTQEIMFKLKSFFSFGRLKENQSVYLVMYLWIILCIHIMYRFVSNKTILTPHPLNLVR